MRKSKLICIGACMMGIFFISCKKVIRDIYTSPVVDSSYISITNASPVISNLHFFLNNQSVSLPDSPISYGTTIFMDYINNANPHYPDTTVKPYIKIASGYQELSFGSYGSQNIFSVVNYNFLSGSSYSLFLTDSIYHGQVSYVVLKDNIAANTDTTKSQIRFINLSPDSPPLDFWAYPNGGSVGYKIFSNCAYLPNDINSLIGAESFSLIAAGPYFFQATLAGTNNAVLYGEMILPAQNIITLYTEGFFAGAGNNAINVGVIQYKP